MALKLLRLIGCAMLVLAAVPVRADVFTIAGLAVEASAQSAAQARDQALLEGQRRAIRALLERLAGREDFARLPRVDDAGLASLVQSLEIISERSAAQRWSGQIAVRFVPDAVRALLRDAGIGFAETTARPVLVLPVWRTPTGLVLWEQDNPWREALAALRGSGLVPILVPRGEPADRETTVERAVAGVVDPALGPRYRAGVMVAQVTGSAEAGLLLAASRSDGERIEARIDGPDAFRKAADLLSQRLEADWKAQSLVSPDRSADGTLSVRAPITGLPDWIALRAALGDIALIRTAHPRLITRQAVLLEVAHAGTIDQLQAALGQRDLTLTDVDGEWVLARRGGPSR
ncbi:MAG: DUF2066 domain-containing protein [Alphaproteobacteria bacterium]|nr:DUF2066 domain-containing protein [Alphaproteobacteria bacterium]